MNKSALRSKYLQKRKELSVSDINILSQHILKHFGGLDFDGIRYLHLFYPIIKKHEVNSLLIADWLRRNHPNITIVLSKSNTQNHTLEHILWLENTPLAMNEWGITEPKSGERIPPEKIDLVVIPLLIFDVKGNRIGYGKGFYDRFLSECRMDVKKVGVSFFDPELTFEEIDEFDIPLDVCVTPHRVWEFKNQ